ncbi:hypothetical protein L914_04665 [Phytophthora nicotianae]|uniref:Uncharacterized protein n=1 Tax=Phytophthora nicotianae TaxID=4792 RepID=W2NSL4_PHYNI|nr:hypothetical protein L914_04665 [Phytophthora nicotianae]
MPKRIAWRDTALHVDEAEAAVLDELKAFDITKNNALTCRVCVDSEHKMRYRLRECSSETCAEASEH